MKKARFIIVGSGWRAMYYVRIAKALPDYFELVSMLCRTQEKAEKLSKELNIKTTSSMSECLALNPDFVVVAVSKSSISDVSLDWLDKGFTVLSETPAATDFETIEKLKALGEKGKGLIIAEQYRLYPEYSAIISLLKSGILGEINFLNISLAHEYHAASLMRSFLSLSCDEKFSVRAKTLSFPVTETLTRYERFTDGRIAEKNQTLALFDFESGKAALYDFDSEQYRSPIRKNTMKIEGIRGQIINHRVFYLDEKNKACQNDLIIKSRKVKNKSDNPNFQETEEIERITFNGKILYEAPFGLCGLSQDESALALLMQKTYFFSKGLAPSPYPLEEAISDSYMALMMKEAQKKETAQNEMTSFSDSPLLIDIKKN